MVSPSQEIEFNMADRQASKYNIGSPTDKRLKYQTSTLLASALVSRAKIRVSYAKCEHNRSSEQLASHSKVTLELVRKI